jgi:hypothetical protein
MVEPHHLLHKEAKRKKCERKKGKAKAFPFVNLENVSWNHPLFLPYPGYSQRPKGCQILSNLTSSGHPLIVTLQGAKPKGSAKLLFVCLCFVLRTHSLAEVRRQHDEGLLDSVSRLCGVLP